MTIQQCRYVLEIARTGSFSQAAKMLFIAQSSLSVSVKSLESELRIKIFERSGNGVFLTDEGAEFLKYARQLCHNSDFIMERYSAPNVQKKLDIVTQHYDFVADVFGTLINSVELESYRFSIREIETYHVIQEVESASSDIGIIAIKAGDLDVMKRYLINRKLSFMPIQNASAHIFLRKEHPLANAKRLHIEQLGEYPYVSYEQCGYNSSFFTEEIMDTAYVSKHIEISDRATLMNVLLVTNAYTVGTGIMPSALNRGDIISIPLECNEYYIIGYIVNENRGMSDVTKQFIDLLNEVVKDN